MHVLRLDIRLKSFQTMCTQGHEYKNNGLDVGSSVIITRLHSPVAIKEEAYGIGSDWSYIALPCTRNDLVASTRRSKNEVLTSLQLCLPTPRSHCQSQLAQFLFDRGITT